VDEGSTIFVYIHLFSSPISVKV